MAQKGKNLYLDEDQFAPQQLCSFPISDFRVVEGDAIEKSRFDAFDADFGMKAFLQRTTHDFCQIMLYTQVVECKNERDVEHKDDAKRPLEKRANGNFPHEYEMWKKRRVSAFSWADQRGRKS